VVLRFQDHASHCHWPPRTATCCAPAGLTAAPPPSLLRPGRPCMRDQRPVARNVVSWVTDSYATKYSKSRLAEFCYSMWPVGPTLPIEEGPSL
jgi:hypothetical protein